MLQSPLPTTSTSATASVCWVTATIPTQAQTNTTVNTCWVNETNLILHITILHEANKRISLNEAIVAYSSDFSQLSTHHDQKTTYDDTNLDLQQKITTE
jgi:hypothetical protein